MLIKLIQMAILTLAYTTHDLEIILTALGLVIVLKNLCKK